MKFFLKKEAQHIIKGQINWLFICHKFNKIYSKVRPKSDLSFRMLVPNWGFIILPYLPQNLQLGQAIKYTI